MESRFENFRSLGADALYHGRYFPQNPVIYAQITASSLCRFQFLPPSFTFLFLPAEVIQSFALGEATPEQAHEIGRLADEVLRGKYPYVLTTHIDKGHVHNHIIFCAVDMVNYRKYVSNKQSYSFIRRTSDRLCKEQGLSVVKPGQGPVLYRVGRPVAGPELESKAENRHRRPKAERPQRSLPVHRHQEQHQGPAIGGIYSLGEDTQFTADGKDHELPDGAWHRRLS